MAKKTKVEEAEREAIQDESQGEGDFPAEPEENPFETDFNVDDEYKPTPLVPAGKYEGFVTNVSFDSKDSALVWDVTLKADDDVYMSDNETPVNGNILVYKNWFPRAGDEAVRTKTGKMTKRQAKINMIQDFQRKMKISMNTPDAIVQGVSNAEWIGLEVLATVAVREYEGRFSNQISELVAI